jgi:pimeloyl-ACP methyl ester carboxylesterase
MRIIKILSATLFVLVITGVGFLYLAPEKTTRFLVNLERDGAGLERKEITTPDGLRWVYLEGGTGTPLLLAHGFGGNKDNFTRTAKYLTQHYRVVIPDLIGFGESDHPQQDIYSPIEQAERLHAFAKALGINDVHLGGNSMGGEVALCYAALHPREVKSLWLLDPGGIWSAPAGEARKIYEDTGHNPLLVKTTDELAALLQLAMSKPPFLPGPVLNVMAQERIHNNALEERILKQIVADSIEPRIKGLAMPTLIVWGKEDRIINVATADILHGLMPNSRVLLMDGIGHVAMIEVPKRSAVDYLEFRKSSPG